MTDGDVPERPPRMNLRIGWAVLALMVIGLLVGGWLILSQGHHPVAGRPTVPPMLGGAGSVSETPLAPTPSVPAPPSLTPPGTATPSVPITPGGDFQVSGVGNNRTMDCADHDVSISGVHNTVTLTGHCGRVDVSGVENTVVIDSSDRIDVSGINNRVTFRDGTPELSKSGIDNTLERG